MFTTSKSLPKSKIYVDYAKKLDFPHYWMLLRSKYASKVDFPDLGWSNSKKAKLICKLSTVDFPDPGCSNIKKQNASKVDFPDLRCSNSKKQMCK